MRLTPCALSGCRNIAPISGSAFISAPTCLTTLRSRSRSVLNGTRTSSFMIIQSRL